MENCGLVSIIMPTYNCGAFIAQAIESVVSQTYQDWELLIQDDCSTDNTFEVVKKYAEGDVRIRYVCNAQNGGAAISRNEALQRAKGRWIAFLDADDMWLPTKLERQLEFMTKNQYAFSYHEYDEIDESGNELGVYVSGKEKVSKCEMYMCCWPGCLTVMYDTEKVGLIQIENVAKNNDTAMWLKVVKKSPCYLLPESLAHYRRRKNSITPKPILQRIWAQYPLFRIAEGMNPILASIFVVLNVFGNAYKKTFYVKKINA